MHMLSSLKNSHLRKTFHRASFLILVPDDGYSTQVRSPQTPRVAGAGGETDQPGALPL